MRTSLLKGVENLLTAAIHYWDRASTARSATVVVRLDLPPVREVLKAVIGLALLSMAFGSWTINLALHRSWLPALVEVLAWLRAPELNFANLDVTGWPRAVLGAGGMLVLGTLAAHVILGEERDRWLKRLLAVMCGLGISGASVVFLAAIGKLSFLSLNLLLGVVTLGLVGYLLRLERGDLRQAGKSFGQAFRLWSFSRSGERSVNWWLAPFCLALAAVMLYHALSVPEFDWDAVVYHATMAKLMYIEGGVPLIAGPSVGLQLSANYPPLFPALGTYFYVQSQVFNDTFLRTVPIVAVLITALATYRIGGLLGDPRYGSIAVVLLLLTPLFFYRSLSATNYILLLSLLTVALLFLLLGYIRKERRYWLAFGIIYGFALLTSYHALFFLPSIALILFVLMRWQPSQERKSFRAHAALGLSVAFALGSIWFIRNIVVVGNPIYPFVNALFGGAYLDSQMLQRTTSGIRLDSLIAFFGTVKPAADQYIAAIFMNKAHYPVLSGLTFVGLALISSEAHPRRWLICLLYILFPFVFISSTLANIFPRYFVLVLPPLALIAGLVLVRSIRLAEGCKIGFSTAPGPVSQGTRVSLAASLFSSFFVVSFLTLLFLFPGLLAIVGGKGFTEVDWLPAPSNYLKFVKWVGPDKFAQLRLVYGPDVSAWQWLNRSLPTNGRLATFENKVYYLLDSRPEAFFYLDGWEARQLYELDDPAAIAEDLQKAGVVYILDAPWIHHWEMYQELPLNRYLGWPEYFPLVYTTSSAKVFQVGPLEDAITAQSPIPVSLSPLGWSPEESIQGRVVRRVPVKDESARIYIGRDGPITLRITYLDRGVGSVAVNLNSSQNTWLYDFKQIELEDTGEWRTAVFVLATSDVPELVELGLYASEGDFYVSEVRAEGLGGTPP